jgi:hypothetical protein
MKSARLRSGNIKSRIQKVSFSSDHFPIDSEATSKISLHL